MRSSPSPRTIAGRISTDGSITTGKEFTCRKIAAGQYIVKFPEAKMILGMSGNIVESFGIVAFSMINPNEMYIYTYNASAATIDARVAFTAVVV